MDEGHLDPNLMAAAGQPQPQPLQPVPPHLQPQPVGDALQILQLQVQQQQQQMAQMAEQLGVLIPAMQQALAAPQAAAAAAEAAQQAAAAAAAAGATAPTAAATSVGPVEPTASGSGSRMRYKYLALSLATSADGREINGRLNMSLDSWRTATELANTLNGVPTSLWVQAAITNSMTGHVQTVALQMLKSNLLPDWVSLLDQLRTNFEPHEQKRIAAGALERLSMKGNTVAALERYVAHSRELHMTAGDLVTPERRWSYFMRGLPAEYNTLLTTVMEATNQPHTFEAASQLALKALANRLQQPTEGSSMNGPVPMDIVSAMQGQGWHKWRRDQGQRGPQQRGAQQRGLGRAGGSRTGKDVKDKGRIPGTWHPQLPPLERKRLLSQGRCLCCKSATDHGWRDCPRNPDNQGNA